MRFILIYFFSLALQTSFAQNFIFLTQPDSSSAMPIHPSVDSFFDIILLQSENSSVVRKLEKLEIGVNLPLELNAKIQNFTTKKSVDPSETINPYIANKDYEHWDNGIRVFATFYQTNLIDDTEFSSPIPFIEIDGFYTKEFESWSLPDLPPPLHPDRKNPLKYQKEDYYRLGDWKEIETDYPFRIRFAPPHLGTCKYKVSAAINDSLIFESEEFSFEVIESDKKGYISAGTRFLLQDQKTFFPVGLNYTWPEADATYDPELVKRFSYTDQGQYLIGNEGYRDWFARPRTYANYHKGLDAIADNGGNYVRTIMYPSATDIEWEEAGNYTDRLHMAHELDQILEHAEVRGLYLHWDLQTHFSFQHSQFAYHRNWCWDSQSDGANFCYRDLTGSDFPPDFFSHEESKAFYKQRLRYILARWGYSTHVAAWELFCEINNVGTLQADANEFYMSGNNHQVYEAWQIEMAEFIKSQYHGQIHPVTSSLTDTKHDEDDTYKNSNFDFMTANLYDNGIPNFARHWYTAVTKHKVNENDTNAFTYQNRKPFFISEADPIQAICDEERIEMRRFMWQSVFSGAAGVLSWDLRFAPQTLPELQKINNFIQKFPLEEGGWHPGSMELVGESWMLNDNFADAMDGRFRPGFLGRKRDRKSDLMYLKSQSGDSVIGVITNKTFNIVTNSSCRDSVFEPIFYKALLEKEVVNTKTEKLAVNNLHKKTTYEIKFYRVDNLETEVFSAIFQGPTIPIRITLQPDEKNYILLFTLVKLEEE